MAQQAFPGMAQQPGYNPGMQQQQQVMQPMQQQQVMQPMGYQQPGYQQPGYQQPGMVVVTNAPAPSLPVVKSFRDTPQRMQCPNCSQDIVTVMTFVPGVNTIICCVIIGLLGGVLGCFLIPFFMDSCKDVIHNCPNCQTKLGRYTKM